jgi:hypothetical protein
MEKIMAEDNNEPAFNDVKELGEFLSDQRAQDTEMVSKISDALPLIEAFRGSDTVSPWTSLDRNAVADRLTEIVNEPRVIQQGQLNLCGPAAFFIQVAARDPVSFATFAVALFDNGSAQIGNLSVAPDAELIAADYADMLQKMAGSPSPQADWMLLGSLRNSTNVFWQGGWHGDPDQELAGMTRPEELASWMTQSAVYASVDDRGRWASNPGLPDALDLKPFPGTDIALLIHANLISISRGNPTDDNVLLSRFPNHWVVLLSEVLVNVMVNPDTQEPIDQVSFRVWTWGGVEDIKVTKNDFIANYFGAVISKLPD